MHLLRFDSEAAARAALGDLHGEDGWRGDVLAVALVTAEAEFGEIDDAGRRPVIVPRQQAPGFFLLVAEAGWPGEIASIERETGRILAGDQTLAGARLDPVWAGAEPILTSAG